MMHSVALLALAAVAFAADTTTINVFLPMADKQKLVGSIIKADSKATTLAFACPNGTPSDECGFPESQTVTQGESTWGLAYSNLPEDQSQYGTYSETINCDLDRKKDLATCTVSVSQTDSTMTLVSSTVAATSGISALMIPVTITAGVEKLKDAAPGATATTGSGTTAGTDSAASGATSSSATNTDNAAWPMATHNALLAGAAALVGGVMAL